jgi:hypothetical protein
MKRRAPHLNPPPRSGRFRGDEQMTADASILPSPGLLDG